MLLRRLASAAIVASLVFAACGDKALPPVPGALTRDVPSLDAMDAADAPDASDAATLDATMDVRPPCRVAADCVGDPAGSACDPATGRCVSCVASADTCPASQHCDDGSHTCMAGCRNDDGCVGATADAGVDAGGDGGAVAAPHCEVSSHTCVACVTNDHCPPGTLCMGRACVPGCDMAHGCAAGQTCCAGGCVDTRTNTGNCGACGNACSTANGTAACAAGACAVGACNPGYADCDRAVANGCETNTETSTTRCGACGTACETGPHATAACASGRCALTCEAGFGDCDRMAGNGCERTTATDTSNCGACGRVCEAPAGMTPACAGGACTLECAFGTADCDGMVTNGCETLTFGDITNCGACGRTCPTGTLCNGGMCQPAICCADLHARLPTLPTGVYPLGPGDGTSYPAYCDMSTEGGGWTLVMMLSDSAAGMFGFDAEAWTDASVINGEVTDPTRNVNMRSRGFYQVPVLTEMRFCLGSYTSCVNEPKFGVSTQSVFLADEAAGARVVSDFTAWGYSGMLGCNRIGINVRSPGATARCRYGVIVNRMGACGGAEDGAIGLGCVGYRGALLSAGRSDGTVMTSQRAWILVR